MNSRTARFTRIQDSSKDDWALLLPHDIALAKQLASRVIDHLKLLDGDAGGYPVNRYIHSLQAATLALKDGRDEEYVVCALLHDIGDSLGSYNHADIAAAMLSPFLSEANLWMVQNHAILQGFNFFHHIGMDRNMRDALKDHPHYARTEEFVALYDNEAFDPARETLPLSQFEPMLHRFFAAPKHSLYKSVIDSAAPPTPTPGTP